MAGPTKPMTARLGTAKASSWVLDFAIPKMAGSTGRLGIAEPTVKGGGACENDGEARNCKSGHPGAQFCNSEGGGWWGLQT